MENKRAQTLEALEAFIQTQRALLARTQSDITRLQNLRSDATARPAVFMSNLEQELSETTRHLSNPLDAQLVIPRNIDWSLYDAHDPKPMQTLTATARHTYAARNTPCPYQRTELSALQKLVKDARRTIVDPVLAVFECVSDLEPDAECGCGGRKDKDPEEERREREREKLRELKKRKMSTQGGWGCRRGMDVGGLRRGCGRSHVPSYKSRVHAQPERRGRANAHTPAPAPVSSASHSTSTSTSPAPAPSKLKSAARAEKPKPETYKQAWSVSEQHLLEQLLEEIPDGEKNRWQKISRAMNGRRTPRQVASRVQKYFEKLKRFGIAAEG
ncbi:putative SANT SWI3, ADA2, N-CoR and TFIIIB'' DNA-binding domains containing protein [Lyophyllum shimeji]|uniref:SANT SWI3, ADA2, N-CoR and TFIIIB'' DNA-binding domains containing protein n=1 Tax=Lyophyllum shimeji TaxID=47721 RepID=A0A9P3UNR8_LYOSH|nr:putative SANT SWI3, ADA2, N-CoR and TFIIIB'' DNA-binding domains containing protein [Lyophyllum shimeji]